MVEMMNNIRSNYYSKSLSNSRNRKYHSRSRETLQRSILDSKRENSRIPPEKEYSNYDYKNDREREDEYRTKKMRMKEEREREEEEYLRRKEYEKQRMLDEESEEKLNYKMKMRA